MEPKWMSCDTCEERISVQANACPHCGHDYRKSDHRERKVIPLDDIILYGWLIFMAVFFLFIGPVIRDAIGTYNAFDLWLNMSLGLYDLEWSPSSFLLVWFGWTLFMCFFCWLAKSKRPEDWITDAALLSIIPGIVAFFNTYVF